MKKVAIVITVIVGVWHRVLLHSRLAAPHPLAPQYASLHLVGFTNSNP